MTVDQPVYDLLPAVQRIRDAELGYPLQQLLEVVEQELARLRADVDGLYDDWFIETCAEWVVPYIGALLGVPVLQPVPGTAGGRALVANTIRYRRRAGTATVLEQVARDVTGWPARAVEYFTLLSGTQHLDHVRLDRARTIDLRDTDALARVGTPFDAVAHSVDVRHIDRGRGRYNLPDIGLHLWRLAGYAVEGAEARAIDPDRGRWTFDPAGRDRPLFRRPAAATSDDGTGEDDVPAPLSRLALHRAIQRARDPDSTGTGGVALTGSDPVLAVRLPGEAGPVPPGRLISTDLIDWSRPAAGSGGPLVAVDPVLGRLTVAKGVGTGPIRVDYSYGFPGDLGAGPHDRRATLAAALGAPAAVDWSVVVSEDPTTVVPGRRVRTLGTALALWDSRPVLESGQLGVIVVADSATYRENLDVVVPPGDRLVIVAAAVVPRGSEPVVSDLGSLAAGGVVPHLIGDIRVRRPSEPGDATGELVLDGLSVEGGVVVAPDSLSGLVVADCTLGDPGAGWVDAPGNRHLQARVLRSICAGLQLHGAQGLTLADSILYGRGVVAVDADSARVDVTACTMFGGTHARILTASNSIFGEPVVASAQQEGCVRFSYLPPGSRAPRRYRCQPTAGSPGVVPRFTTTHLRDPAFGQLARDCPEEITTGADDEGEMGAYHFLQQPRRMANLSAQPDKYLRFGLEAGFFFVT